MTVKAIMFTKEDIVKEMKRLHEYIAEHKKQYPDYETNILRGGQIKYAESVESHFTSMLCNFDYKATEVEIVKAPIFPH